ncbi:ATP-binding protein [Lachnospiraceae bacterium 62-35]
MKREIVRLQKIELRNLKNVGYGCVKFAFKNNVGSDVLGLYGQNGSGKTILVYALDVLKEILIGKSLDSDLGNYIKIGELTGGATVEFSIVSSENDFYKIVYEFNLERKIADIDEHIDENDSIDEEEHEKSNRAYLVSEKISMARLINDKWTKMTPILYYNVGSTEILPKNRYHLLTGGKQDLIDELRVLRLLTTKEERSFLFSKELRKMIRDSKWEDEYKFIFKALTEYAIYNLHVFSSEDTGMINANIALPFSIVSKEKDKISLLKGCLNLDGVSPIPRKFFGDIQVKMEAISLVLKEIIPGLTISLQELSTSLNKKGEEIVKAEIIAKRANIEIPLRYESDGVKKLVSILYCLILVFNDRSMTLVVDEFDSGIFEYLLGEILKVVEESGKGQLIFTSHNLRALEVLNNKNIMFTTTNENNRYIRFKNIKANNNFRDVYFHDIVLGGQNECVYEATNPYMIARAFRLAGDEDAE